MWPFRSLSKGGLSRHVSGEFMVRQAHNERPQANHERRELSRTGGITNERYHERGQDRH